MDVLVKSMVLLSSFVAIVLFFLFDLRGVLIYTLLFTNIVAAYQSRNVQLPLVAILYIFTYNFHYFLEYNGAQLSPYTAYQSPHLYGIGAVVNLILLVSYILFLNKGMNTSKKIGVFSSLRSRVPSAVLFFLNLGIIIVIIFYLFTKGVNLFFASGDLYELYKYNLENIGGIAVYFNIFFFLLFLFQPPGKHTIYIHVVFFVFLSYALSRGTRMIMIPPLLIYFFYFLENRFNWTWIVGLSASGMAVLTAIDRFKNGISIFSANTKGTDIIINNQAEILYGANAIIAIINNGVVDVFQRVRLLFGFFFTGVLPPGLFSDSWKYPHFASLYNANAGGGGLASVGTYVIASYMGPLLLGLYLALMTNSIYSIRPRNSFSLIFYSMSLFMITRWYTYDLNVIIRIPLYTVLVFQFLLVVSDRYKLKL